MPEFQHVLPMFPVNSVTYLPGCSQEHPVLLTQLSHPINFVKLDRIRKAFEVNLTVASESERLAATQLANDTRCQDLAWVCRCTDPGREIDG